VSVRAFHATVVDVIDLSPAMRRVVFGGADLAEFRSTGVGDEYIRLLFPEKPDQVPDLPPIVNGSIDYSAIDLSRLRTYTVRDHDPVAGTITVDFVVHEGGVAAQWALQATPGQVIAINSPDALYSPPPNLTWLVLVADYAGLPAAARIAETAPENVRVRLIVEIADDSHRIPIAARPNLEVTWVIGGNGHGPSKLEEIVRSLPRPDGVGYIWVAGESRTLRGVRKYLRKELGLPATAYKTVGYWIERAEQWRERYAALDEATKRELESLWSSGRDEEEIEDEYNERLTRLGL
jgi:NADPH-dependent ferric siderophore reductase